MTAGLGCHASPIWDDSAAEAATRHNYAAIVALYIPLPLLVFSNTSYYQPKKLSQLPLPGYGNALPDNFVTASSFDSFRHHLKPFRSSSNDLSVDSTLGDLTVLIIKSYQLNEWLLTGIQIKLNNLYSAFRNTKTHHRKHKYIDKSDRMPTPARTRTASVVDGTCSLAGEVKKYGAKTAHRMHTWVHLACTQTHAHTRFQQTTENSSLQSFSSHNPSSARAVSWSFHTL